MDRISFNNIPKNKEEFEKMLASFDDTKNYILIDEKFRGMDNLATFECRVCGNIHRTRPNTLFNGKDCICIVCKKREELENLNNEFIRRLHNLFNDKYSLLERLTDKKEPAIIRNNETGRIHRMFLPEYRYLRRYNNIKIEIEENSFLNDIIVEIYELLDDEYSVMNKYLNEGDTHLLIYNNITEEEKEVEIKLINIAIKNKDAVFLKKVFKTTHEFCKEVYELVGDEYTVLGEYTSPHAKIEIRHNKCGIIRYVNPDIFLNDPKCIKCYKEKKIIKRKNSMSAEEFKKRVYDLTGDDYTVLGELINIKTKIGMVHNICGHEWNCNPHTFLHKGTRCPSCALHTPDSPEILERVRQEIHSLVRDEYAVICSFDGGHFIKLRHNKCGYTYRTLTYKFIQGERCFICQDHENMYLRCDEDDIHLW